MNKLENFWIYTIHNIVNNKIYVGKARNVKKRWYKHLYDAKNNLTNQYIHKALRKYGADNFIFSVVQNFKNENDCIESEKYWIKYFKSFNSTYGYNLTDGGEGASGRFHTVETKQKISKNRSGKTTGIYNHFYGKTHSAESKNKISLANAGLKRTEDYKLNKSKKMMGSNNHFFNKKHSKESIAKISGENSTSAKLTESQVKDIFSLYKQKIYTQKQLGLMYNISQTQVWRIVNGKRWVHLINGEVK